MKNPFGHIGRVIALLNPDERKRLTLVGVGVIFMSFIEKFCKISGIQRFGRKLRFKPRNSTSSNDKKKDH